MENKDKKQGKEKDFLIVVDMQNDFLSGSLGSEAAQKILPEVKAKIKRARAEGRPILFTRDTHGEEYPDTQEGKKLPVRHCIKESFGWQIADGLWKEGDKIFDKPVFGSLSLAEYLLKQGAESAELVGVCTDICVVSNALLIKAFCPETEVCVDGSCCAGLTQEKHAAALETMRSCQVDVREK